MLCGLINEKRKGTSERFVTVLETQRPKRFVCVYTHTQTHIHTYFVHFICIPNTTFCLTELKNKDLAPIMYCEMSDLLNGFKCNLLFPITRSLLYLRALRKKDN